MYGMLEDIEFFFIDYIEVEKMLLCTFMWVGRGTSQPPLYSMSSSWLKLESGVGQEVSLKFNSEGVFLRKACLGAVSKLTQSIPSVEFLNLSLKIPRSVSTNISRKAAMSLTRFSLNN